MLFLYILLAISFYSLYYRYSRDLLHPCGVFLLIWYLAAAISNVNLDTALFTWSLEMHLVVIFSGIFFLGGSFLFLKKRKFFCIEPKSCPFIYRFLIRFLLCIAFICFFIELRANNFQMSFGNLEGSDAKAGVIAIPFIHYGTILLPFLVVSLFFEFINQKKKKWLSFCFIAVIIFIYSFLFGLSRGDLLMFLFSFLFIYTRYYHIKLRTVLFSLIVMVIIVIGLAIVRVDESSVVYKITDNPYISIFYSYIATCFANLNQLIQSDLPFHPWGNATFRFFWTLLGQKESFPVTSFEYLDVFNAKPYLYAFYHDYKFVGILIFPYLMGVFFSFVYNYSQKKGFYSILFLALLQKAIFFSFFGNYLFGELVILFPFLVAVIFIVIVKDSSLMNKYRSLKHKET